MSPSGFSCSDNSFQAVGRTCGFKKCPAEARSFASAGRKVPREKWIFGTASWPEVCRGERLTPGNGYVVDGSGQGSERAHFKSRFGYRAIELAREFGFNLSVKERSMRIVTVGKQAGEV